MSSRGLIIALSGIDGAGKSTHLARLDESLSSRRRRTVRLWTRGGYTPGMNLLKGVARSVARGKLPPPGNSERREELLGRRWLQRLWMSVAIVDLMWIYGVRIRWWLLRRRVVLCDRYLWDSLIDFEIMFPRENVAASPLWKLLVHLAPVPSVACLLMIPQNLSEQRCRRKYEPFPDSPERRRRRYELYARDADLRSWKVIDATRACDAVFIDIVGQLE